MFQVALEIQSCVTRGARANGSGYMLQIERRQEAGPIEITLFGTYTDKLVKTSIGWRIKDRQFRADTWRGDAAGE